MMPVRYAVLVVALLACSKKSETGSGSTGSATVGSAGSAGPAGSAGSAKAGAASPELLKALDEMDRVMAPIFKLEPPARFDAFCAVRAKLAANAQAIAAAPAPPGVADWAAKAKKLENDMSEDPLREPEVCCRLAPQGLKGKQRKTQDGINDDCVTPIHESFKQLVASVPGAPAADAHANDPLSAPSRRR
jgi:hypothetical protein